MIDESWLAETWKLSEQKALEFHLPAIHILAVYINSTFDCRPRTHPAPIKFGYRHRRKLEDLVHYCSNSPDLES